MVDAIDADLASRIQLAADALVAAGAREVYVFGSCAHGRLREGSDIDFAVVGLPPRVFFKAMGQAVDIVDRDIDLIDLDDDTPFTRYLQEQGELVRVR
jgi:predicted nucleotidyltransferase